MSSGIVDINKASTVFGTDKVIQMLNDAVQKTRLGEKEVLYINKKTATPLLSSSSNQKAGVALRDGIINTIADEEIPVNILGKKQTETKQFRKWFGNSVVRNEDGSPKVMYHGTRTENGEFWVFDYSKAVKKGGLGLKALGEGIYFTEKKLDGTERYGSRVLPVYLKIEKPFINRVMGVASRQINVDKVSQNIQDRLIRKLTRFAVKTELYNTIIKCKQKPLFPLTKAIGKRGKCLSYQQYLQY